jgi:hypothetical protein
VKFTFQLSGKELFNPLQPDHDAGGARHPRSFKELARRTGLGEKSLHRMLHRNGNPTARNLEVIIKSIAEDPGIKPRVEFV